MKILKTAVEFVWKSLIIGLLYVLSLIIVSGVLGKIGLKFPEVQSDFSFMLLMMLISGFIISIAGGIIVKDLKLSKLGVFVTLYLMFFLNTLTQLLEALFFLPEIRKVAPAVFGVQFVMYMIVSAGISLLFKYNNKANEDVPQLTRSRSEWFWRILISSASYVLFYFIFGSINEMLFTGDFYRAEVSGLFLPSTSVIMILESIRSVIIVISVLPIIVHLKVSKIKCMITVGMTLFIIGGLLPMLQQLNNLPTLVVITSIVEMFFQFFLTGVVTTYIILYERHKILRDCSLK